MLGHIVLEAKLWLSLNYSEKQPRETLELSGKYSVVMTAYLMQSNKHLPGNDQLWLLLMQAVFNPLAARQRPF